MSKGEFAPVQTGGCLSTSGEADRQSGRRYYQRYDDQRQSGSVPYEPREFLQYDDSPGSNKNRRTVHEQHGDTGSCFETTCGSIRPGRWDAEHCDECGEQEEASRLSGWYTTKQPFDGNRGQFATQDPRCRSMRLRVAHLTPISIRPKSKAPQIVNVCQTYCFPDNYITQNNANRFTQKQEQYFHQYRNESGLGFESRQPKRPCNTPYSVNRCLSRFGGFFGANRHRQRSMHSQTSRTLLELVEEDQNALKFPQHHRKPTALPRTLFQGPFGPRMAQGTGLIHSESESTIGDRIGRMNVRQYPGPENVRSLQVPYFEGKHPRKSGIENQPRQLGVKGKLDHRKPPYEDSPFVGDPVLSISRRGRKQQRTGNQSLDDVDDFDNDSGNSDVDALEDPGLESDDCVDRDVPLHELNEESEDDPIGDSCGPLHRENRAGGKVNGTKEPGGISCIVDKLQDNVWDVCLEGIRDLMDMAGRIDWKAQEKYITVINRKLIEFLKSPRTALCRTACQVSGELFREAKSTKRPEFDEIVDILLCKTADPNRFIQKDANVALDKLVTYIPTAHTVRALSIRGTIHRNPLVRIATARLLVCICVVSGLDAILGTTANTRTRKTILSMLAKMLMDKNLETRKFGERVYRMLRKHKFFDEYFYKDMDSSLRTNLKRVLKGM